MPAPVIPTLPEAPSPSDSRQTFNAKAFPFVQALGPFGDALNGLSAWLNENINLNVPVNIISTSADLSSGYTGGYIRFTNTSPKTLNVLPESSEPQQNGANFLIVNAATGDLTISPGSGVTINNNVALGFNSSAILQRVSENTYDLLAIGGEFSSIVTSVNGRIGDVVLDYDTPAQAALASLPVGAKYSTKGADAVGDGGHGDFIVEAASGTPDGYSRVLLANGNLGILQPVNGAVNLLQFGGDVQLAINSGYKKIIGSAGNFVVIDTVNITQDDLELTLLAGCNITLETADVNANVFNVSGSSVKISGGNISTNLRTLRFLVNLSGYNSQLTGCKLSFATKSTIAPIGGTDIPYNRGGVSLRGVGTSCYGCEIYNQEGAGIVTYGTDHNIEGNDVHDNVLGIHAAIQAGETTSRTVRIVNNNIHDNNVNHASGAVGILSVEQTNIIVTGNRITGNGEHGTYIYSEKSTISNNYVSGNYRNGLKVRAARDVVLSNNVVVDNNIENAGTSGSIVIQSQLSAGLDPENNRVIVTGNISNGSNCIGIITSVITSGHIIKNLVFTDNVVNSMQVAADSDVIIASNIVATYMDIGAAFAAAPSVQTRFQVCNNIVDELRMNRCADSVISNNTVRTLTTGSQFNNIIRGNKITGQDTQIARNAFSEFSDNQVNCSSLGVLPLLLNANTVALNSFKRITGNTFLSHAVRVIDDSSSAISGNKNVITGNSFDSTTEGISIWGSGHTISNNININSGGVGFVGCNNSWLIGNSPKITERAGTTGNQNI